MEWVNKLRGQFPVTEKCTYLDASYDLGGALFMRDAAVRYFDEWSGAAARNERGGPGRETFFKTADRTRSKIAELLGGVPEDSIAFTKNTNEGMSIVLMGFNYKKGDNIVTVDMEHPSVLYPCLNAAHHHGIECRIAETADGATIPIDCILREIDENTRIVAVSHVQSASGYKIDLKTLGAVCKERGIFLLVDATQSMGLTPLNVAEWNVSAVAAAGYKGMQSCISVAFLYCHPDLVRRVTPLIVSSGNYISVDKSSDWEICHHDTHSARKFENGSLDALGIYVMESGLDSILGIGLSNIQSHISNMFERLYNGLTALGYTIVTPFEADRRNQSMAIKCADPVALHRHFIDNNVIVSVSQATGFVRLAIAPFTNESDIDIALKVAESSGVR